jgi:drug/metabolite transporter (DMT)-like permease
MVDRTPLFLLIGMAASVLLALGLVFMKSRAAALPPVRGLRSLSATLYWLRDPVWFAGLAVQAAGYALYLIALSGAPVSMLAVMMQGGIAIFVLFAVVFLRERATRIEWFAVAGVLFAMALLSASLRAGAAESPINRHALAAILLVGILAAASPYVSAQLRTRGIAPALASGIAVGLGSLYGKAFVDVFSGDPQASVRAVLASPWIYLARATNLSGLVLLQNSFHWARGIIAMPLSSACSNLVPIVGGIVAFGERLPADNGSAALRVAAFALTIVASGFLAFAPE